MKAVNKLLMAQFLLMCQTGKLFLSSVTGKEIWNLYLNSFSEKDDPVFRDPESSVHNCNHCNNFIRRYGNIVAVDEDGIIMTIFDVHLDQEQKEFANSFSNMSKALTKAPIQDVFFETYHSLNSLPYEKCNRKQETYRIGIDKNVKKYTKEEAQKYGVVKPNEIRTFHHMYLDLPKAFVDTTDKSIESIQAHYRDKKQVFQRAMEEIPGDTLHLVKDLINQESLLDGKAHLPILEEVIKEKGKYELCKESDSIDNWFWVYTYDLPERVAKFKNTLIGVLCTELAEGMELNKACRNWNKRVDPVNYMKAKAPITETQKKLAQQFVEENDYVESFDRRFAVLDDIKTEEIKHINIGNGNIKSVSIFDDIKTKSTRHKRSQFDGIQTVSVDKFMKDILPSCSSVEVFVENKHENNFVTLTTTKSRESKPIFKWDNPYSWTYNGNIAGKSMIKKNVSKVGGNIEAILRCSLQWNDKDTPGFVDFDLHSKGDNHIYFSNKGDIHSCGGHLDVDMINPSSVGIENITWRDKLADGVYNIGVQNYNHNKNSGFKVEIEFHDETFNYHVKGNVMGYTEIAKISVVKGNISIEHLQPCDASNKEVYGIETQQFHKAKLICLSPNHWGDNNIGNKHYFFMLDKAKTESPIRSFHAENLLPELAKHRKVLEVLGNVHMIEPGDEQLSGVGFNATVREEVILRLKGSFNRVVRVKF